MVSARSPTPPSSLLETFDMLLSTWVQPLLSTSQKHTSRVIVPGKLGFQRLRRVFSESSADATLLCLGTWAVNVARALIKLLAGVDY